MSPMGQETADWAVRLYKNLVHSCPPNCFGQKSCAVTMTSDAGVLGIRSGKPPKAPETSLRESEENMRGLLTSHFSQMSRAGDLQPKECSLAILLS